MGLFAMCRLKLLLVFCTASFGSLHVSEVVSILILCILFCKYIYSRVNSFFSESCHNNDFVYFC